ncbi:alpha/beta hydrolase [Parasphingorhabdus pacifica]
MPSRAAMSFHPHGPSYEDYPYWLRYQRYFPGGLRSAETSAPEEQWWSWRGTPVHVDRWARPQAPAKVIALHGAGTYGRMLAPYGRLPAMADLEFVAPDLPGFGLSGSEVGVGFGGWRRCVLDLIAAERSADARPIVLFGTGSGGLLAYDVAARAPAAVAGVVVTCLADARRDGVRRALAANPALGRWASSLALLPGPLRSAVPVPLRGVANLAAASNHEQFANLMCSDPLGGGRRVPLSFVRTFLGGAAVVDPHRFAGPPLLLAHPAEDRWVSPSLSRAFFDAIPGTARFALLNGAGHVVLEESGLADLDRALRYFLADLGLG